MIKKDIPTDRSVIGYQRGEWGIMRPVVVLDATTLWVESRYGSNSTTFARSGDNRYSDTVNYGYGHTTGYLVTMVTGSDYDETGRAEQLDLLDELLKAVPAPADLTGEYVGALSRRMPKGLTLGIVNNRHLHGPSWEAIEAQQRANREAQRKADAAAQRKREANADLLAAIMDEIKERGFAQYTARPETGGQVSLPLELMAALLGIETEGN
jgi:hypothetical protein